MTKTLHINVTDKVATYRERDGIIVCGNSDYVIKFAFDGEWNGYNTKTARFISNASYEDVVFTGDTVAVPVMRNTTSVAVGVFSGDLKTTTPAIIGCQKSILCRGGIPSDPTPDVYNQIIKLLNEGGGGSTDISDLETRIEKLEKQLHTTIAITSFSTSPLYFEIGSTVTSLLLNWKLNKAPTELTLETSRPYGVETLSVDALSKSVTGISATHNGNVAWNLKAVDEMGATDTKTANVNFCNGVYYGVAAEPTEYNSAFVRGLSKELRATKKPSVTVIAGEGQYIYYCLPVRMGQCTFIVGGFTGGFELVDTIEFTNASGYTESYRIYRSDSANLGDTSVTII